MHPRHWPQAPAMQPEVHFGGVPMNCFATRPRSVHGMLERAVICNADGDALVAGARRESWRTLAHTAAACAGGLRALGVSAGDRVLLLLHNRAEFVITLFALARLGAVAVPLSVRSAPPEVLYVAQQSGARLAIVEDELLGHVPADMPRLPLSGFEALAAHAAPPIAAVNEEDVAVILYTSGTTGRPKGAMLSHLNIVHSAMHYECCMALTPQDRSLLAVPLSHVTGLVAQGYTMAQVAGTLVLLDHFKARDFLQLAAREAITHTLMVPAMYQLCLLQGDLAAHELSAWRIGAYGGAPMAPATIAALAQTLPQLTLLNCYGATETTSPATIMPPGATAARPDSVGVAVPCGALRVVDADGRTLPPGETGEIWIAGPMVVKGYWDNAEASAREFSSGFWHSGDLGRIDEQDFVQVLDRLKDVINRGGYKVFSSEVEAVLLQHPAVLEAAIVGFACPVLGERVMAFLCLREATDAESLKAFCGARLSDYKVPERWQLGTEPLPRNANGKLMKRALRDCGAGPAAAAAPAPDPLVLETKP